MEEQSCEDCAKHHIRLYSNQNIDIEHTENFLGQIFFFKKNFLLQNSFRVFFFALHKNAVRVILGDPCNSEI